MLRHVVQVGCIFILHGGESRVWSAYGCSGFTFTGVGGDLGDGSFHSAGARPFFFPGLMVKGAGQMAFPLAEGQAKKLIALAEQAALGKGTRTVLDADVRKCWQMDAAAIRFEPTARAGLLAGPGTGSAFSCVRLRNHRAFGVVTFHQSVELKGPRTMRTIVTAAGAGAAIAGLILTKGRWGRFPMSLSPISTGAMRGTGRSNRGNIKSRRMP